MKIIISFDFELGWGVLDSVIWRQREAKGVYEDMRSTLPGLLRLMAERELPATWALVSSMLCPTKTDVEIEHLSPGYRDQVATFLEAAKWTTWNASDLCEVLLQNGKHEIATHTATHLYASHPSADMESFTADVSVSLRQLTHFTGRLCSSIIYPRDQTDWNSAVARRFKLDARVNPAFGLKTDFVSRASRSLRNIGGKYPRSNIYVGEYGELYHSGSIYFNWCSSNYSAVKKIILQQQVNHLVAQARNGEMRDAVCHVWLHPFNLSEDARLFELFKDALVKLASLRDEGLVEMSTMADVRAALPLG